MQTAVLTAIIALSALALFSSLLLAMVARAFAVPSNPRVEEIEGALPGANCGGCGLPGLLGARAAHRRRQGERRRVSGRRGERRGEDRRDHGRLLRGGSGAQGGARALRRRRPGRREAFSLQRDQGLHLGGDPLRRRQGVLVRLSRSRNVRGRMPLRRAPHAPERPARGRSRQVHRVRKMRDGVSRSTSSSSFPPASGSIFSARRTTRGGRSARSARSAASDARNASRRLPRERFRCRITSRWSIIPLRYPIRSRRSAR